MMQIRAFEPEEAELLAAVYRDSVLNVGPRAYSPEQVRVWALHPEDIEEFRAALLKGLTLVSETNGQITAFGQLHPMDHIAYLYCASAFVGQGHGSAIHVRLERAAREMGVQTLTTEASRIARPFFERKGFQLVEVEHPVRHGVAFERFRMHKRLKE